MTHVFVWSQMYPTSILVQAIFPPIARSFVTVISPGDTGRTGLWWPGHRSLSLQVLEIRRVARGGLFLVMLFDHRSSTHKIISQRWLFFAKYAKKKEKFESCYDWSGVIFGNNKSLLNLIIWHLSIFGMTYSHTKKRNTNYTSRDLNILVCMCSFSFFQEETYIRSFAELQALSAPQNKSHEL